MKKGFFDDHKGRNWEAKERLEQLHIRINLVQLAKGLGVGTRRMIELVKALSRGAAI